MRRLTAIECNRILRRYYGACELGHSLEKSFQAVTRKRGHGERPRRRSPSLRKIRTRMNLNQPRMWRRFGRLTEPQQHVSTLDQRSGAIDADALHRLVRLPEPGGIGQQNRVRRRERAGLQYGRGSFRECP